MDCGRIYFPTEEKRELEATSEDLSSSRPREPSSFPPTESSSRERPAIHSVQEKPLFKANLIYHHHRCQHRHHHHRRRHRNRHRRRHHHHRYHHRRPRRHHYHNHHHPRRE